MDDPLTTEPEDTIEALRDGLGGRWLVTSQGSQHVWDLDAMTYQRLRGEGRQRFAHDDATHPITRVVAYPAVGASSHVFFDDPLNPDMEQWRISSTIRLITRLPPRVR
ncbi:hypothetical protein SAMN05892883_2858 [Jatrophihabitans sp. GAS493]|uniref:hypothetical protein n=1 Tax=Jatrophihabitans sp. GAS493 TaxID=1907575 RepID=UPI000BC07182|nr:hypothetical protein [Jatrophihabitans sp. GAS493]SOD73563.1 hypothetical protein SAMN05892883_2858 [Jatrophihabitans sp. GAS493]